MPQFGLALLDPHPVWLVVVVIAARYGTRGLAIALMIAWGGLAIANGADGPGRVLETLAMPIELGALAASVLVAWIVSGNERREQALAAKVGDSNGALSSTARPSASCAAAALALRARNDRLDLSLTFLRNVARRLHGADAEAAAQAALELIGARLGARAASVEMRAGWRAGPAGRGRDLEPRSARSHGARRRCGRASRCARWSCRRRTPRQRHRGAHHRRDGRDPRRRRGARCTRRRRQHGGASRPFGDRGLGVARHLRRRTGAEAEAGTDVAGDRADVDG